MSEILIFAGTTEGRRLAEILEKNRIACDVCVATEYGSQMIKSSDYIKVHEGRLDRDAMKKLYNDINCRLVVDATHPFAKLVTENIRESLDGLDIQYLRFRRAESGQVTCEGDWYKNIGECVKGLLNTSGRILLTTGSKELKAFAESPLKERLVVRVLPGMESLNLCYEAGLEGRQIIAMQGPFSESMNLATFTQYRIEHLVTKESGSTGGFGEKVGAAVKAGVKVHVIERPDKASEDSIAEDNIYNAKESTEYASASELIKTINSILNLNITIPPLKVALIGIGCGNSNLLTKEAADYISQAGYIFGAQRMLDAVKSEAIKYPYYLKADIVPKLEELYNREEETSVAVLFSGDSGFYSGTYNLCEALKRDERFETVIMPGISSISLMSARTGIDWGRAKILSLHGRDFVEWQTGLRTSVMHNRVSFAITSGAEDIRKIGKCLSDLEGIKIHVGYNLSYEDESVECLTPSECDKVTREGLYVAVIVNEYSEGEILVPCMSDEEFIRDKVPMTKEAVRELSICKLKLKKGDVVYDIGSGTGSVAVQMAMMSDSVKVYALECKDEALELIRLNREKFRRSNIHIIKSLAPQGLEGLEKADCAFIGGTKGNLKGILDALYSINSTMRIVINAVSLESITEVFSILNNYSVDNLDITQANISTARKLGEYNLMQANNPVYIFSFDFC